MVTFPEFFRVRQTFESTKVADVAGETRTQLEKLKLEERIKPGQSVAVSAGSRGIANIAAITKAIVDHLKRLRAEVFVVPAMGSHGGGTAAGQIDVLASYGM